MAPRHPSVPPGWFENMKPTATKGMKCWRIWGHPLPPVPACQTGGLGWSQCPEAFPGPRSSELSFLLRKHELKGECVCEEGTSIETLFSFTFTYKKYVQN